MIKNLTTLPLMAFIVLVTTLQAIAQTQPTPTPPPDYYGPGPWHMWNDGYGWPFWGMFPMMMLCIVLICVFIFFLARRMHDDGRHHWGPPWHMMQGEPPTHSALQILNERFARGEIQKDEYEERKAIILSGH